eukprot:COSAG01_NODE_13021_length_1648_cov_1.908974_3_plen_116_part_00
MLLYGPMHCATSASSSSAAVASGLLCAVCCAGVVRVRLEITGSQQCATAGESQPVLMLSAVWHGRQEEQRLRRQLDRSHTEERSTELGRSMQARPERQSHPTGAGGDNGIDHHKH